MTTTHKRSLIGFALLAILSVPALAEPNWLYTIRPGENIWTICKKYTDYSRCWMELADLNQVERTRRMKPGQQLRIPMNWLKNKPIAVSVNYVAGDVQVQKPSDSDFASLVVGEQLPVGSVVRTTDGAATLLFADGSTLQLEGNTSIVLDAVSNFDGNTIVDSSIRLQRGAVKANVKSQVDRRFQIHTPAAVASVRGTEYRVSADTSEVSVARSEVLQGEIEFFNALAAQSVKAGFASAASETSAPIPPVKLLAPPSISLPNRNVTLPYELSWLALDQAERYQLSLFEDGREEQVFRRDIVSDARFSIDELALGCYGVAVAGVDARQFQGRAALGRLCFVESLVAPQLSHNLIQHGKAVEWAPVKNAKEYLVQTSLDPEFTSVLDQQIVIQPSIELNEKRQLYIRVAAIGVQDQLSDFSNVGIKKARQKPWWLIAPVALLAAII